MVTCEKTFFLLQISKHAFDERIDGIFAFAESLPHPATLDKINMNSMRQSVNQGTTDRFNLRYCQSIVKTLSFL